LPLGDQTVPQIYKYFDVPDIAGLIAPRPLLIEMGVYDTCFLIEDQLAGFEALKSIYAAAGAEEDLKGPQIAQRLDTKPSTIYVHLHNMREQGGAGTNKQLMDFAKEAGLLAETASTGSGRRRRSESAVEASTSKT